MNRTSRRREQADGFTLLELMVVMSLLTIVMGIVAGFLISAGNAVASSSVHVADSADARTAVQQIASTVQFAKSLSVSADGKTLSALQEDGTTCDQWTISGSGPSGTLQLQVGTAPAGVVARGVSAPTTGAPFATSSSYPGLITVRFKIQQNAVRDVGISVDDTVYGDNAGAVNQASHC